MRRLTPNFVRHFAGRMINIHPSLLPKHPGLNTHKKALAAGDLVHGCSMHYVTEVLDGGPVIAQFSLAIAEDDDELGLRHRVLVLEHYWYWRVLNQVVLGQVVLVQGEVLYQGEPDLDSAAQFFCG